MRSWPMLRLRGTTWYYQRAVPLALRPLVSKTGVWKSLGTSDKERAKLLGLRASEEVERTFQALRRRAEAAERPANEGIVVSDEVIPPEGLRSVPGLDTPKRFYRVLQSPAPFAGMSFPDRPAWKAIAGAGFESIVCLTDNTPPYDPSPLRVLRALKFKDLFGGARPDNPQREAERLHDVVRAVVDELRVGRGVVVHCAGGTGRTGTVIACALAALGMPEAEVLKHMTTVNVARGKSHGWPESDWQKSQVANFVSRNA